MAAGYFGLMETSEESKPLETMAFQFDEDRLRDAAIYVRWGFERRGSDITRVFVGLELHGIGRRFRILHFDNSHNQPYHRHAPGFPNPGRRTEDLDYLEPRRWVSYARKQIKARWRSWVDAVTPINLTQYVENEKGAGLDAGITNE